MNQLIIASHSHKIQLWISRIRECRASKQTVTGWCTEHDISVKSYYWMRKIKAEAFEALSAERKSKVLILKPNTSFAEVALPEKAEPCDCAVKPQVNGFILEIQNGADSQTIEHTLRMVSKLC